MKKQSKTIAARAAAEPSIKENPPSKSVTTASNKDIAILEDDFTEGGGFENVTSADIALPRLVILQSLSPQLQRSKKEYIKGAQAGMFCDTSTNEIWDGELTIIPCYYARIYLEWAPDRGGLIQNHGTDGSIMKKTTSIDKKPTLKNGNTIAETATYFVLNMSAGGRMCFIPLSSTQMGASKRWMVKLTGERIMRPGSLEEFNPDIFYRSWTARPVETSNTKGTWSLWDFEPSKTILELDPTRKLLKQAKDFRNAAKKGLVRIDIGDEEHEDADVDGAM